MEEKGKMIIDEDMENNQLDVDEDLVGSMKTLLEIQDRIAKINEEAIDKVLKIEQMCNEKLKPLYDKRNNKTKDIRGFWPKVFFSHPFLGNPFKYQTLDDMKMFDYFTSLEVNDEQSGYSITFNFKSNPYFENTSIKKTFIFPNEGTTEITATPIKWKEGIVSNGVGHEKKLNIKPIHKDSFFLKWFICEEQKKGIDDFKDRIADSIKEDLWPNLLSYFKIKPDRDEADDEKGTEKGEVENNPRHEALINSFETILKLQDEIDKINEEAMNAVLEVEKWQNEMRKPEYDKRNGIIETIDDFWRISFLSHPVLTTYIKVEDEEIFKHFISLEVEGLKDENSGYSITFNFEPNCYFENTKLTKTFRFLDQGTKITATPIEWKRDKLKVRNGDLEKLHGKYRGKGLSIHNDESFFEWFVEPDKMQQDLEDVIAEIIKEDLWPNPLTFFPCE